MKTLEQTVMSKQRKCNKEKLTHRRIDYDRACSPGELTKERRGHFVGEFGILACGHK